MRPEIPHTKSDCTEQHFDQHHSINCSQWVFDQSVYRSTVVSEWNLVCGDEWKVPLIESVLFSGVLVSALLAGILADAFGRRHVLMSSIVLMLLGASGMAASQSYTFFQVCNFFGSIGQVAVFQTAFILAVENVGKKYRV